MCQMSVVLEKDGDRQVIMESVILLEAKEGGIEVSTLFDPPKLVPGAMVKKMDFSSGTVTLVPCDCP
jgi:predicted RNA-binding protein